MFCYCCCPVPFSPSKWSLTYSFPNFSYKRYSSLYHQWAVSASLSLSSLSSPFLPATSLSLKQSSRSYKDFSLVWFYPQWEMLTWIFSSCLVHHLLLSKFMSVHGGPSRRGFFTIVKGCSWYMPSCKATFHKMCP